MSATGRSLEEVGALLERLDDAVERERIVDAIGTGQLDERVRDRLRKVVELAKRRAERTRLEVVAEDQQRERACVAADR